VLSKQKVELNHTHPQFFHSILYKESPLVLPELSNKSEEREEREKHQLSLIVNQLIIEPDTLQFVEYFYPSPREMVSILRTSKIAKEGERKERENRKILWIICPGDIF